jgi:hypothetical protein
MAETAILLLGTLHGGHRYARNKGGWRHVSPSPSLLSRLSSMW